MWGTWGAFIGWPYGLIFGANFPLQVFYYYYLFLLEMKSVWQQFQHHSYWLQRQNSHLSYSNVLAYIQYEREKELSLVIFTERAQPFCQCDTCLNQQVGILSLRSVSFLICCECTFLLMCIVILSNGWQSNHICSSGLMWRHRANSQVDISYFTANVTDLKWWLWVKWCREGAEQGHWCRFFHETQKSEENFWKRGVSL